MMGLGWLLGGLFFIAHSGMCLWIGLKKPTKLFNIAKKKLGKKATDRGTEIFCYVFVGVDLVISAALLYFGMLNG